MADDLAPARPTRMTRTRAALHGALLELLTEKPFDQVTVREITARAQVGYATFFRRYPDKEALLGELAEREISELLAMALPILQAQDSGASARALCAHVWAHRKLWSALLTGGASAILRDEFVRQARQKAAEEQRPETEIPADLHIVFSVKGALEVLAWWLMQDEPMPVERIAGIFDRMVIAPSLAWSGEVKG